MIFAFLVLIGLPIVLSGCVSWTAERRAPPIGEFTQVSSGTLHYVDLGPSGEAGEDRENRGEASGLPPVVLIHGASVNLRDMKMALGDILAQDRRVIAIDRPGRGYSERGVDGWRLDHQARAINDIVRELGLVDPIIVGQSFGGAVALSYAINHADDMSGLILLAAVSHEWPGDVVWYNKVSGWPVLGSLFRRGVLPIYAPLAAEASIEESFEPDEAPPNYYERAGLMLLFRAGDFKHNAADIRHLKSEVIAMTPSYSSIDAPTYIITGEDDTTVSPQLHSMALAKEIPGARLQVLPETGHALHHSETQTILNAINALSAEIVADRLVLEGEAASQSAQ